MYDEDSGELFVGARSRNIWVRGLLTLLFLAVLWFIRLIVLILAAFQFVHAIVTGGPNPRLLPFARSVANYIRQMAAFVTWTTEMRPWPWSTWPSDDMAGGPAAPDDLDEPFEPDVAYTPPPPDPVEDEEPPKPAEDTAPEADVAREDPTEEEPPAAPKPKSRSGGAKGKKKKKNPRGKASDDPDPTGDESAET